MYRFWFAVFTALSTWVLLLIGGIVNPMGASMACPDWYFFPTCNGELFPEMTGGVLYEHGHRLWATLVGFETLVLAFWILKDRALDRFTKGLSGLSLGMVCLQGTLGGITVLLNLNALLSTLHLVVGMIFFCLLILIAFRLGKSANAFSDTKPGFRFTQSLTTYTTQGWLLWAVLFTLAQILIGGAIRHMGAGMACGDDFIACGPEFWPSWHLGQIHMFHRFVGYALTALVIHVSLKTRKEALLNHNRSLALMALSPLLLVIFQVILGLATIATIRSVYMVVLHTGVGALLLASLWILYLWVAPKTAPIGLKAFRV